MNADRETISLIVRQVQKWTGYEIGETKRDMHTNSRAVASLTVGDGRWLNWEDHSVKLSFWFLHSSFTRESVLVLSQFSPFAQNHPLLHQPSLVVLPASLRIHSHFHFRCYSYDDVRQHIRASTFHCCIPLTPASAPYLRSSVQSTLSLPLAGCLRKQCLPRCLFD